MGTMFTTSGLSTAKYNELLVGWGARNVKSGVPFDASFTQYSPGGLAQASRQHLISDHGWTITDGGAAAAPLPAQTVTFTSVAPAATVGGTTYAPAATGGGSGLPVRFTIDDASASVCSITSGVVSFTGAGDCVIRGFQAGNGSYEPGAESQTVTVGQGSQAITFTSAAPAALVGGATYTPTATGGASRNPVLFTIDAASAGVCAVSSGVVSFTGAGACVINANQAGNTDYLAAAQVQQSVSVSPAPPPPPPVVKGTQRVTGVKTSLKLGRSFRLGPKTNAGIPIAVRSSNSRVCKVTRAAGKWRVTGKKVGVCKLRITASGNALWNPLLRISRVRIR
jgi:hypothetical protein